MGHQGSLERFILREMGNASINKTEVKMGKKGKANKWCVFTISVYAIHKHLTL